jgi:hypothetical protein
MKHQNVVHIELSESGHIVVGFHWQEVCYLGPMIDNDPNGVITFLCTRQTHYEIHADIILFPDRYLQRL